MRLLTCFTFINGSLVLCSLNDTIAAISTPPGRGGIGIVRISGPRRARDRRKNPANSARHAWKPWTATLAELPDAEGHAVDHVVVTFFAAPRSYTAEDVVEISCHGSPVVLRYALERACDAGARLAEPGEFTLRAYLNGRIDLPQAEAVRDLIEATTLYQARIAAQQAEGSVSRRLQPVKEQIARTDRAARSRHRFRRGRHQRRAARRKFCAASSPCSRRVAR